MHSIEVNENIQRSKLGGSYSGRKRNRSSRSTSRIARPCTAETDSYAVAPSPCTVERNGPTVGACSLGQRAGLLSGSAWDPVPQGISLSKRPSDGGG
jgi:hypothetical protein